MRAPARTAPLAAACLLALAACGPPAGPAPSAPAPSGDAQARWVQSTLGAMTLDEKVGQMLVARVWGDFRNVGDPALASVLHDVRDLHVGGVTISVGSPPEIAGKAAALQRAAKVPLLISADLEYGPGMRLWRPVYPPYMTEGGGGTVLPYNMGLAATGDPALAEKAGRLTAEEARAVGINWIFAPDVDVNTNPANPVINVRSYGADPHEVSRFAEAFIRGVRAGGALTTAKHFPGHGDTGIDSHLSLPVLPFDAARLDSVELVPFRAAIAAGVDAVMLGHLAVPALTGGDVVPATLSPAIATGLLRDSLGFKGIVVTDAMTMGALRNLPGWSPGGIAVRAVEAGADVVLSPPDVDAAHAALLQAVRSGRIPEARIDASVRRILAAKARLGLERRPAPDLDSVVDRVASPAHDSLAAALARRSIVLVRDSARLVPLEARHARSVAAVAYGSANDFNTGRALADALRRIYGRSDWLKASAATTPAEADSIAARADSADAVVLGLFLGPVSGKGTISLPEPARRLAERLAGTGKSLIVVSFGDPYGAANLPQASTYLLAWQPDGRWAQEAAARAIAGRDAITGRLPIPLAGLPIGGGLRRAPLADTLVSAAPAAVGMDPGVVARVDSIIRAGIADGAAPGVAVAIGRHGNLVELRGFGRIDWAPGSPAVTDSTLYDLASLSKVIGTTTAVMQLVQGGELDLDAPVARYLPEWTGSPEKMAVTVRQLMLHEAGFPPFEPLWRTLRGREQYLHAIATMPLQYTPGTKSVYSDFSMITMQFIIERITGVPLDVYLREHVFAPLRMRDTRYNPVAAGPVPPGKDCTAVADMESPLLGRIAYEEVDTVYRHIHVHGVVHDENACALGGVAGHAGLFSSARDLAKFAQMMLDGGRYGNVRILDPETIARFTTRKVEFSSRALGWDTPAGVSSAGDYLSERSFGHTGFTGTSISDGPRARSLHRAPHQPRRPHPRQREAPGAPPRRRGRRGAVHHRPEGGEARERGGPCNSLTG